MKKMMKLNVLAAAVLSLASGQQAMADIVQLGNVVIQANNDQNNGGPSGNDNGFNGEGVFISSNVGGATGGAGYIQLRTGGGAAVSGITRAQIETIGAGFAATNGNGGTTSSAEVYSTGTTFISTASAYGDVIIGNSDSSTTLQGQTNNISGTTNNVTGVTNITGATTVLGNTSVNASGAFTSSMGAGSNTGAVTIGNASNVTTIQSGTNNITGVTNNMTASGAGSANNISGTTNINASINAATSINTGSSTGNVTVGNAANTTSLNSATNNIGVNAYATINNMGTGSAASANNIGTGVAVTTNRIGNTNPGTTVSSTAGNASQSLANNSANTLVSSGTSALTARTGVANVNTSAQVLLQNSGGTTVDANGKILTSSATGYVAPTAATAALTLTNGYGNTHGMVITESQTTVSGGMQSSSLTLSDTNARFSHSGTGNPITVTGVADGRSDFDAVNVRQFAGAVAAVSAQANIPGLQQGQDKSIGIGVGNFMGKTALGLGLNYRGEKTGVYRLSVATGMHGGVKPVVGAGAAWSF